ncbi:MAG: FAD-dependent oxidoreductase, partial [Candidatus Cloacimonetes bacterium]|nr:FAD-dependent oxidoreductase [Candidatus Cloacimonadota bacterium]
GESLSNIFSANEYLTRINLMKAYLFPEYDTPLPTGKNVTVIGGGNVAMDCARNALRTGAKTVSIVYRRSMAELPARNEEIHHAEQEGIIFRILNSPVKYIGDNRNMVKAMECIKMELGAPDDSGRRRPVPIEGSNYILETDMVIVAVGTGPNPTIFSTAKDIELNRRGYIVVNEETMESSKANVYAGGDIVTGAATVILAMGAGRTAAKAIHKRLSGEEM